MLKGTTEQIERTSYLLELGIDFQANDLESFCGGSKRLSKEYMDNFYKKDLGKWVFAGNYNKKTQTVLIKVEKELFTNM